jgi:membrane-bound acyltransferase YfiQ involved in biofilm formation
MHATASRALSAEELIPKKSTPKFPIKRYSPKKQVGARHLFVDNVRFWSMLAIVGIHCVQILGVTGIKRASLQQAIEMPLKFGTIAFFLISGFLLGERIQTCSPVEYLSRRLRKVFLPWFFWVSILVAARLIFDFKDHQPGLHISILSIAHRYHVSAMNTPFWFVPNLLVSLCVLLFFRRHLYDLRLGGALLAINLVYVVNIYALWFPNSHVRAWFGFVFYLWLGSYASRHIERLKHWVSGISMSAWLGIVAVTGVVAFGEACLLIHLKDLDPGNTLRFSNQIFSIVVVLFLLKVERATWPKFVDVPRHTFGIYLSHYIVLLVVVKFMIRTAFMSVAKEVLGSAAGLVLWAIVLSVTYTSALMITKAIAISGSFEWMVGLGRPEKITSGSL